MLVDVASLAVAGLAVVVLAGVWLWFAAVVVVGAALAAHWAVLAGSLPCGRWWGVRRPAVNSAIEWYDLAARAVAGAARSGAAVGLVVLHLDGWRPLRHRIGVAGRGRVLGAVAAGLGDQVRPGDLEGQFDGHGDFVLLLPGVDEAGLAALVERARAAVRAVRVDVHGPAGVIAVRGLTASVGCARYPVNASNLYDLILAADNAMFGAKVYVSDQVRVSRARTSAYLGGATGRPAGVQALPGGTSSPAPIS